MRIFDLKFENYSKRYFAKKSKRFLKKVFSQIIQWSGILKKSLKNVINQKFA